MFAIKCLQSSILPVAPRLAGCSFLWAIACIAMVGAIPHTAGADAVLEGFENPERVPGSYVIVFNDLPDFALTDQELGEGPGWTDWEIRKRNRAKVNVLAGQVAGQYRCRNLTDIFWVSFYGFSGEFDEADILALAKDPRIARIDSVTRTREAAP